MQALCIFFNRWSLHPSMMTHDLQETDKLGINSLRSLHELHKPKFIIIILGLADLMEDLQSTKVMWEYDVLTISRL